MQLEHLFHNGMAIVKVIRSSQETLPEIEKTLPVLESELRMSKSGLLLIEGSEIDMSSTSVLSLDTLGVQFLKKVPSCKRIAVVCPTLPLHLRDHYANICVSGSRSANYFSDTASAADWLVSG